MNNHHSFQSLEGENTIFDPFGDFIKTCVSGAGTIFNKIAKWVKSVILLIISIYAKVSI